MVVLHLLTGRGTTTTAVTPPVFRSGGVTEDNVLGRGLSQPVGSLSS